MRRSFRARPIPPKVLLAVLGLVLLMGFAYWRWQDMRKPPPITDYDSCVAAGQPILESYPEQCVFQGQSYINPTQNIPKPY